MLLDIIITPSARQQILGSTPPPVSLNLVKYQVMVSCPRSQGAVCKTVYAGANPAETSSESAGANLSAENS